MAYKVFSNGNTLPASDLNTYLMNQSVIAFASTTARDAAIPSPNEGMLVWLEDSNKYVQYNGTAWVDLIDQATIAGYAPRGNAIINGAFDIWQRGAGTFSANGMTADRWNLGKGGTSTIAITQQTFTPGTAPVAGYEGQYFLRFDRSSWNSNDFFGTKIEDVRTFAGQTVTLSFWAKAAAGFTVDSLVLHQNFGSGGSASVYTALTAPTFTTSWARYTFTATFPVITGKTIGTGSHIEVYFRFGSTASNMTLDLWGVQLEAGSVATPFKRNAPSIQAELAACQRYYQRYTPVGTSGILMTSGFIQSSTLAVMDMVLPVQMRIAPSSVEYSNIQILDASLGSFVPSTISVGGGATPMIASVDVTVSGATAGRFARMRANGTTSAYIGFSAEL